MYGNANEAELTYVRCDKCTKKILLKDAFEHYSETDHITWFDGTFKPKLMLYCGDCNV